MLITAARAFSLRQLVGPPAFQKQMLPRFAVGRKIFKCDKNTVGTQIFITFFKGFPSVLLIKIVKYHDCRNDIKGSRFIKIQKGGQNEPRSVSCKPFFRDFYHLFCAVTEYKAVYVEGFKSGFRHFPGPASDVEPGKGTVKLDFYNIHHLFIKILVIWERFPDFFVVFCRIKGRSIVIHVLYPPNQYCFIISRPPHLNKIIRRQGNILLLTVDCNCAILLNNLWIFGENYDKNISSR